MSRFIYLSLMLVGLMTAAATPKQNYYEGFGLTEGQKLVFPDFDLVFKGRVPGPFFPNSKTRRMADVLNFEINKGVETKSLKWSSGTGEISPVAFKIGGMAYVLSPYLPAGLDQSGPGDLSKWYVYPQTPSDEMALKTPALFVAQLSRLQILAEKNPQAFGKIRFASSGPSKKFSISTRRWLGRHLESSDTATHDLARAEWFLPAGYYAIRGESPASAYVFIEVKASSTTEVKLEPGPSVEAGKNSFAQWTSKKRVASQLGRAVTMAKDSVLKFPDGFELGLARTEDQLISHYICFELPPGSSGAPCTTVPVEKFKSTETLPTFLKKFTVNSSSYEVEIKNPSPVSVIVRKL